MLIKLMQTNQIALNQKEGFLIKKEDQDRQLQKELINNNRQFREIETKILRERFLQKKKEIF